MRRLLWVLLSSASLSACLTARPPPGEALPWSRRVAELQHVSDWQLAGRAAVAVGNQGWQANLDWRQHGADAELHLSGPLGIGAMLIREGAEGLSVNGAPPSAAAVTQLEDRLGFELPLTDLRYWLLGVPEPNSPFELVRDGSDRAERLTQAGWTIDYERYLPADGDLLPTRVVLSRDATRVRIVIDRWLGVH